MSLVETKTGFEVAGFHDWSPLSPTSPDIESDPLSPESGLLAQMDYGGLYSVPFLSAGLQPSAFSFPTDYHIRPHTNNVHFNSNPDILSAPPSHLHPKATIKPEPQDFENPSALQLRVLGLPPSGAKSRVETHIKLCIQLLTSKEEKVTSWGHLRLPEHLISKERVKSVQGRPDKNVLNLEASVVCASDLTKSVSTCFGCIQRERKRSQRRKDQRCKAPPSPDLDSSPNQQVPDRLTDKDLVQMDQLKILVFNCNRVLDFSSGDTILPTRITCYCRHHNEKIGFRIQFVLRNHLDDIIATGLSPPIMITDDHKSQRAKSAKRTRDDTFSYAFDADVQAVSIPSSMPSSMPSSSPEVNFLDDYQPEADALCFSSQKTQRSSPASKPVALVAKTISIHDVDTHSSSAPRKMFKLEPAVFSSASSSSSPSPTLAPAPAPPPPDHRPELHRVIPAEGPLHGGVEVTLLGSNFYDGVIVSFGGNDAVPTSCWSTTTLICILPPSTFPGTVAVTVRGPLDPPTSHSSPDATTQEWINSTLTAESPQSTEDMDGDTVLFKYKDETDRQLMELALQVVGMKMTGKLEDVRQIALSIMGMANDSNPDPDMTFLMDGVDMSPSQHRQAVKGRRVEQSVMTALHKSLAFESDYYVDISVQNATEHTLLHLAVLSGYPALVSFLVEHGAELDVPDTNGFTPLHFATWLGLHNIVRVLLHAGANQSLVNAHGYTAAELASDSNIIQAFTNSSPNIFLSPSSSPRLAPLDDFDFDEQPQQNQPEPAAQPQALTPPLPAMTVPPPPPLLLDSPQTYWNLFSSSNSQISTYEPPGVRVYKVAKLRRRKRDRMLFNFWIPIFLVVAAFAFVQFIRLSPTMHEVVNNVVGVEIAVQ